MASYSLTSSGNSAITPENWAALTPEARARLTQRVILVGSESTGKTTLAGELVAHYRALKQGWFVEQLDGRGERWVLVTGTRARRLAASIRAVDEVIRDAGMAPGRGE